MINPINQNYQQAPAAGSQSQPKPSFFKCFSCFFRIFTLFFSKKDNQPAPSLVTKNISKSSEGVASIPSETFNRGVQGNCVNQSSLCSSQGAVFPHDLTWPTTATTSNEDLDLAETPTNTTSNNALDKPQKEKKTVSFEDEVSCILMPSKYKKMLRNASMAREFKLSLNPQDRVWGEGTDIKRGKRDPSNPYSLDAQIAKKLSREQIDKSIPDLNSIATLAKNLNQKAPPVVKRLFPDFPVCIAGTTPDLWEDVACEKMDDLILYVAEIQRHTVDRLKAVKCLEKLGVCNISKQDSFMLDRCYREVLKNFPHCSLPISKFELMFLSKCLVHWSIAYLKGDNRSFVEDVGNKLQHLKGEIEEFFSIFGLR